MHDQAYELVKAIKSSSEFAELEKAIRIVNDDPEAKRLVDGFRERQAVLQRKMMAGESPEKEEMEQVEQLYEALNARLPIRQMFESERRLSLMMDDINGIIARSLEEVYG